MGCRENLLMFGRFLTSKFKILKTFLTYDGHDNLLAQLCFAHEPKPDLYAVAFSFLGFTSSVFQLRHSFAEVP